MREKPPHRSVAWHSKSANHNTHRCFYIDGTCQFSFLMDSETSIDKILLDFFHDRNFISLKEYSAPDWNHIGLIDYFPETNEIFLSTEKRYKNLVTDISTGVLYKDRQKKLLEERKEKEEFENAKYLEDLEKQRLAKEEKERKHSEKMLRKAKKEDKKTKELVKRIDKESKAIAKIQRTEKITVSIHTDENVLENKSMKKRSLI